MSQKAVDILMPVILFGILFAWMAGLIHYSKNTVWETYTISCEVTDKHEEKVRDQSTSAAMGLLLKMHVPNW